MQLFVGDLVQMRKSHPCGSDRWTITRTGADVKIKCEGCGRVVMLDRPEFEKRVKKILTAHSENEAAAPKTEPSDSDRPETAL